MVDRSGEAIARYYENAHDRIVGVVGAIDADAALSTVPGTPKWTVHDLLAHLVSVPSEIASGKLKGIPTSEQAQAQVEDLKRQASYQPGPPQQGGFLPGSQQYPPSGYPSSGYQNSGYAAPPPLPSSGGGFSNFLHNAATTAAGVIAGEIAFDSLSSLFGHRGSGFFGGGIMPGSETIVNNYYDDRGGAGNLGGGGDSRFADIAGQDQNISPYIDDERDNSGNAFLDDSGSGDDGSSFDSGDDGGSSDV